MPIPELTNGARPTAGDEAQDRPVTPGAEDQRLIYASRVRHGADLDPLLRLAVRLGSQRLMRQLGYTAS